MSRSTKRSRPTPSGWNCPTCTFENPLAAFKCEMCNTRKGTSTRTATHVDSGAIEIQRTIQEQIAKTKARRSDSSHNGPNRRVILFENLETSIFVYIFFLLLEKHIYW